MPDRVVLTVAEAPQSDVGLGRARVDTQVRDALRVDVGGIIQILGKKSTAVKLFRVMQEDESKGIIRIDGLVRRNLGVSIGDKVEVRKAEVVPAERVAIAPILSQGHRISFGQGIENFVKRGLLKRPLTQGEVVIVPGIALMGGALPFMVANTSPATVVQVQDSTVVELLEEPVREDDVEFSWERVADRLLLYLGELQHNLETENPEDRGKALALSEAIREQLHKIGVEEITVAAGDPFDATQHEAVGEAPDSRFELGRVKQVVRKGVRDSNRILRKAQVILVGRDTASSEAADLATLREEVRRLRYQVKRMTKSAADKTPGESPEREAALSGGPSEHQHPHDPDAEPDSQRMRIKLCLVGETATDKTTLIRRSASPAFDERYIVTLGSKVSRRELVLPHPFGGTISVDVVVWDIQRSLRNLEDLKKAYFHGTDGVLAVCNLRKRTTLAEAREWVDVVQTAVGIIPVVFVANDLGVDGDEAITEDEVCRVGLAYRAPVFFTSTAVGENVESAFRALAEQVVAQRTAQA